MSVVREGPKPVLELRVALTTEDYERLSRFYREGLGLEPSQFWDEDQGRALVLELGRATLEVFDEEQARTVDAIEAGRRVSGPVRFALRVPDLDAAKERLLTHGAKLVHPPVVTPWGDRNARFEDPDGMQVTLFQASEPGASDGTHHVDSERHATTKNEAARLTPRARTMKRERDGHGEKPAGRREPNREEI